MNGLTLSESYYHDCGKAVFESTFKSLMDRIAVGLVGPGSECFGFDDEYSQDHDWGPSFCLWVTEADFQTNRRELQDCYNALPKEHLGFGPRMMSPGETGRVGAMEISGFYQRYTGLNKPPTSLREWDLPPENLALCTNGRVFSDPLGDFSRWRSTLLDFYPEDMRLKKMADCCMHAGQSGQYNWQRGILRKDPFVTSTARVTFCTEIMRLVYLLNKTYAPYYKLLFRRFKQFSGPAAELTPLIEKVLTRCDDVDHGDTGWKELQDTMELVCQKVIRVLQDQGFTNSKAPFLTDHVPAILSGIKDQNFGKQLWGRE